MILGKLFQSPIKEIATAITVALVTNSFLSKKSIQLSAPSERMVVLEPKEVEVDSVFTSKELETIRRAYGDGEDYPLGKFVRGRHGYTHYVRDGVPGGEKGTVVLCNGIGTSHHMYKEFSNLLTEEGFSTIRYDYFGHGYSKHEDDMWVEYDQEMFVDQLEDLLLHVSRSGGGDGGSKVEAVLGHSTGGLVAIYAADRWGREGAKREPLSKIVLVTPALWAVKPIVARIADKIPGVMASLMKSVPSARFLIGDSYMEAGDLAFAKDKKDPKQFMYTSAEELKRNGDERLFGRVDGVDEHPFFTASVFGINGHSLRMDLLQGHRDKLVDVLRKTSTKVFYAWGELDKTVPIVENVDTVRTWEKNNDNLKLTVMENLGHECFCEDSGKIAEIVLPFLQE